MGVIVPARQARGKNQQRDNAAASTTRRTRDETGPGSDKQAVCPAPEPSRWRQAKIFPRRDLGDDGSKVRLRDTMGLARIDEEKIGVMSHRNHPFPWQHRLANPGEKPSRMATKIELNGPAPEPICIGKRPLRRHAAREMRGMLVNRTDPCARIRLRKRRSTRPLPHSCLCFDPRHGFLRQFVECRDTHGEMFLFGVLDFVVADPVQALREHHHGRHPGHGYLRRVVQRS